MPQHPSPSLSLRELAQALGRLVVPVACPGCGAPETSLCTRCAAPFLGPARDARALAGAAGPWWRGTAPPAVGVVRYETTCRRALVAWKDHGRRDLTPVVGTALARSVIGALRSADRAGVDLRRVGLVPVPSSRLGDARRSGNLVQAALNSALPRIHPAAAAHRIEVQVHPVLRRRRHASDQAGLSATGRQQNMSGTLTVAGAAAWRDITSLLLIDDILTTGASLNESSRALAAAGAPAVVGAAVVAVTPRGKGPRGSHDGQAAFDRTKSHPFVS